SSSGLPPWVSGAPVIAVTGFETCLRIEPGPTASSVLTGTSITLLLTLAGRAVPVTGVLEAAGVLELSLITMKTSTTASTTTMLPPAISIRRRDSARRAAACWAAICSRALCRLFRSASPICCVHHSSGHRGALAARRRRRVRRGRLEDDQREQQERDDVHARAIQADRPDLEDLGVDQVQDENNADQHRAQPSPADGWQLGSPGPRWVDRDHENEETEPEHRYRED